MPSPSFRFATEYEYEIHAVRSKECKYIYRPSTGTEELYNLIDDPLESRNLINFSSEQRKRITAVYRDWYSNQELIIKPKKRNKNEADLEKLKSLGYIK